MGRLPRYRSALTLNQYPKIERSSSKISDKNILELRTGKNHIIRILLECIKYIIHETNIVFYQDSRQNQNSDETQDLIIISNQDESETIAVHIELNSNEFEHYFCDTKAIVGVNIMDLFKVIKSVDKDDIIFLYVEKGNTDQLFISTENSSTKEITKTAIRTIDHEDEGLEISDLEFDISVDIPSQRFQKICKDFNSFKVNDIQISIIDKKIAISSVDGDVSRNVILTTSETTDDSQQGISIKNYEDNYIYKGCFTLAYFNNFTKATPLCDKVTLFLRNDGPLMVQYKVVNIGELSFILSPNSEI